MPEVLSRRAATASMRTRGSESAATKRRSSSRQRTPSVDQLLRREVEAHDVVGLHLAVPEVRETGGIREERSHDLLDLSLQTRPQLARREQAALDERLAEALAAAEAALGVAQLFERDRARADERVAESVDALVRRREDQFAAVHPDRLRVVLVGEEQESRLAGALDPAEHVGQREGARRRRRARGRDRRATRLRRCGGVRAGSSAHRARAARRARRARGRAPRAVPRRSARPASRRPPPSRSAIAPPRPRRGKAFILRLRARGS